ncbi:MAG: accessory factor UbiK family protein [Thiohalocapsa sp.]
MLDPKQLDDLARRMAASMPKGIQVLQEDLNRSVRATIEAGLGKLDLVTREDFDVQAAVLARTRAKLEALQERVVELEAAMDPGSAAGGKSKGGRAKRSS